MREVVPGLRAFAMGVALALFAFALGAPAPAHAQDAVCAQVKIEIKQKLSLERQAFDAVMRINNGLDTDAVQNIGINLTFEDQNGNAVIATSDPSNTSASFFVRVDSLDGINAIDGTGSVAPKTTGEIHWLIIPAAGTGGVQPQGRMYFVGASLTYTLLGNTTTVAVTPDFITVKPQPLLALDYFLAGDVYADDAFTPAVEPPVPFTLGVRIRNVGGGPAAKVSIESAQPKIVDNAQGLLIGFQILDSYVNDQPAAKTLIIDFGDIGPGASAVGRWNMVTTLSGKFIDLTAAYTHADSLGGALTSLIQGVATHLLVHDVKVDLPGRDNVRDFLALDVDVLRVYESEGTDTVAIDQSAGATFRVATGGTYDLAFPPTTGFAFVKVPDPFAGQAQPGAVLRSDGKNLPPENVWLSKTRNANLTWSYFVNFFDANTTGLYNVRMTGSGFASLAGVVYADLNDNGIQDAGETGIGVTAVTLTGVDDQGAGVDTTAYAAADGTFSFVQLRPGTYSLKVAAVSGYVDGKLKAGTAGGTGSGNTIGGIALGAGVQATGYLFAKVAGPPPPTQADVALTMTASATTVPLNGNVTLTLKVANAGPALAAGTQVTDVLPPALSLVSAIATTGAYNVATGLWSIGNLAAGANATLTIIAKVTSVSAAVVNTASASSTLADPDLTNNNASVTLNADAGTLDVAQAMPREARILAFVGCAAGSPQIGNPAACTSARASFLSAYLGGLGYDATVVTALDAFVSAFRSGRYNTYWVSADDALSALVMSEIREAVFRGDTLILDQPPGGATGPLDDATGIQSVPAAVGTDLTITLVATSPLETIAAGTSIVTQAEFRRMQLRGGTLRAQYTPSRGSSEPAIATQAFGQGHGLVAAFDLVGTLQLPASAQALHPLIVETLNTNAPQLPSAFVGDAYVPLTTAVRNLAAAADVEVTTTLPIGFAVADASPAPASVTGPAVTWRFPLPDQATQYVDLGIRAPLVSGSYPVSTTVSKIHGGAPTLFGTYAMPIVVGASDQFGPKLIADLQALNLANGNDRKARDTAVTALQSAQGLIAANRFDDAFGKFVAAADALAALPGTVAAPFRIAVARWLQEAEQRWYLGLPVCGSAATAPQAASGITFTPFSADEGLEVRGGAGGRGKLDWAWSLGTNRTQASNSVQQTLDWITGKTYGFTLTYDGQGGGSYTVTDAGSTLFTRVYSNATGKLRAGNTVEVSVNAKPEAGAATIEASVLSVNGKPVVGNLLATGTVQPGKSSLYFYYPAMTGGFQLAGSVRLTFPISDALLGDRLDFTVTSGTLSCRAANP
ncbi:MAG: SdrD B-like domain-containing protein [Burkholderiales bacterium]